MAHRAAHLLALLLLCAHVQAAPLDGGAQSDVVALHTQFMAHLGGQDPDPGRAEMLQLVAERLLSAVDVAPCSCTFEVFLVRSKDAVAFSMVGGYIYISRAMLDLTATEAEVAAVLGHEIAHVLLQHALLRDLVARAEGNPQEKVLALEDLGRALELEADAYSIELLWGAGYDPMAQARLLERMSAVMEKTVLQTTAFWPQYPSALRAALKQRRAVAAATAESVARGAPGG